MKQFISGQRWINDAQIALGLGRIINTDFRTVTVQFDATGETFVYAKDSVPLMRINFAEGDYVKTSDGMEWRIEKVQELEGIMYFQGGNAEESRRFSEEELDYNIQFNRPAERLYNAQIDRFGWFDVRLRTWEQYRNLWLSPLYGLTGGRVSIIPHQLYVASEVASRHAPRVLLADEVGLGKTIEAGMVVHQQIVMEKISRVLLVVPDSLIHQWLVEMLRRFNLRFQIIDHENYHESQGEDNAESPNIFESVQLALVSLSFLTSDSAVYKHCRDAGWDMLIVDEAHHLKWSESEPSLEYALIEQLSEQINSVLLLTATPEQRGKNSHFARLRLLDPVRFSDYETFSEQENNYQVVADMVEQLIHDVDNSVSVVDSDLEGIAVALSEKLDQSIHVDDLKDDNNRYRYIGQLLDRHGTGRAMFRNTRARVSGFPQRQLQVYPLNLSDQYQQMYQVFSEAGIDEPEVLLYPDILFREYDDAGVWYQEDAKVSALADIVQSLSGEKVLVIAASSDSAIDLARVLAQAYGIVSAAFHQDLSLLERDRAVAWFAESDGAQVLVCSEMGSEGRNFQFAQHLVLFDLPDNPDLLEQRIGRLDRIGQAEQITIHVLYYRDSAQEVIFNWYHHGLDAFAVSCPIGSAVKVKVKDQLNACLLGDVVLKGLIDETKQYAQALLAHLDSGRNRLLEYNSCRQPDANALVEQALARDHENNPRALMEFLFDCIGVDYEVRDHDCYVISPGQHMSVQLKALPEEGMTVTYERDTALVLEDVAFLTWSHPLVAECMDVARGGEFGNTALAGMETDLLPRGTMLLESVFVMASSSEKHLQFGQYLPPRIIRVLIDQTGKRYDSLEYFCQEQTLDELLTPLPRKFIRQFLQAKEPLLRKLVKATNVYVQKIKPDWIDEARGDCEQAIDFEIERLIALQKVNNYVRQEEVDFYVEQKQQVLGYIENSSLQLDALRVIVVT